MNEPMTEEMTLLPPGGGIELMTLAPPTPEPLPIPPAHHFPVEPEPEPMPEIQPYAPLPMPKQWCQVARNDASVARFYMQVEQPEDTEEFFHVEVNPHFSSQVQPRRTATQTLRYRAGSAVVWEEDGPIDDLIKNAIDQTYPDVDAIYQRAIGMRATEYADAEEAARAYLVADPKPTVVSGYITGHALSNPTGLVQSEAWAAQQIIERADAFRWAQLQMRNVRFNHQGIMRAAMSVLELEAAVDSWNDFLVWMRSMLGL